MLMKKIKKCVILCARPIEDYNLVQKFMGGTQMTICADGGIRHARPLGLIPDVVLGDFDSYQGEIPYCREIIRLSPQKDDTDTMYAVKLALERGMKEFWFWGVLGGRLDHTYANLQTLSYLQENDARGVLLSSDNAVFLVHNETVEIPRQDGYKLSVFSYSPKSVGVSLRGVEYPLTEATLSSGFPLGVSNEFAARRAVVTVKDGTLLVILSKDN